MPPARRKAAKLPVPESTEEAIALLGEFAQLQATIEAIEAHRREARAKIDAHTDIMTAPVETRLKEIFNQLKPWWAVSGAEIAGKSKSTELGGCKIGHRMTTPRLVHTGMKVDEAIAVLQQHGWNRDLVRTKFELDKPAILKVLGGDHASALTALGFKAQQKEEFFIDPLPGKKPATQTVSESATGMEPSDISGAHRPSTGMEPSDISGAQKAAEEAAA